MGEYIIPAAAGIVVALIEAVAAAGRHRDKQEREAADQRQKERDELLVLVVQGICASIALGEATAHALQRGHTNGDTEAALQYAADCKHRIRDTLTRWGIQNVSD